MTSRTPERQQVPARHLRRPQAAFRHRPELPAAPTDAETPTPASERRSGLPAYSGDDPQCIKCGHLGAHTEWCPANRLSGYTLKAEHLRRTCSCCGYGWDEALANLADQTGGTP